jgi:hypothetical protein
VDRFYGGLPVSTRNVIQMTFDEFGKAASCEKKSGSWYRRSAETIFVLNLQKSQYGLQYYINVGLWLLALEPAEAPKEHHCPIRTRLDNLVSPAEQARLTTLLDLETLIDEGTRREELLAVLQSILLPTMDACSTLAGLRSEAGQWLLSVSLVGGDAQRLLASGG